MSIGESLIVVGTVLTVIGAIAIGSGIFMLYQSPPPCAVTQPAKIQIRKLSRQAARWSSAAKQDANPLVAVLHANYGAGYLWALNDLFTAAEIEAAEPAVTEMGGYAAFAGEITQVQDEATRRATAVCPAFAGGENIIAGALGKVAGQSE